MITDRIRERMGRLDPSATAPAMKGGDREFTENTGMKNPLLKNRESRRLAAVLALCTAMLGVAAETSQPSFEAASVKVATDDPLVPGVSFSMKGGPGTSSPGRITYTQVSLLRLIMKAWDIAEYQVVGPAWLKSERYTILATLPPDATKQQFQLMLQELINHRFEMRFHLETRRVAGYRMVIAKDGPRLRPASDPAGSPAGPIPAAVDKDGFPLLPPGRAAGVVLAKDGMRARYQSYTLREFALVDLHTFLAMYTGGDPGPIEDASGLSGRYDFTLFFDSGPVRTVGPTSGNTSPDDPTGSIAGAPNVFRAIERQLGLKLVRASDVKLDVMTVDHINRMPTEN